MATYSSAGLVLKRTNFGEADRLVTLLTEKHGRVTAIARGVRKPLSKLRGFIELFTYGDFRLAEGKTFETVVEVNPKAYFKNIREDPDRQTLAYGLAEMILVTLQEKERHPGLLEWAVGWLGAIDHRPQTAVGSRPIESVDRGQSTVNRWWTIVYYTAMLLQYFVFIGHAPNLEGCSICHQSIEPQALAWSHDQGGFVHQGCDPARRSVVLDVKIGKLLRFLVNANPKDVGKLHIEKGVILTTLYLLREFFIIQIGRELRIAQTIEPSKNAS